MLSNADFRKQAHAAIDWIADYLETIEQYPVKSPVRPGEISDQIPNNAPVLGEDMDVIMQDFKILFPEVLHIGSTPVLWPYFHLMRVMKVCLLNLLPQGWELMQWFGKHLLLQLSWKKNDELVARYISVAKNIFRVIHDTASTSSLVAIISAREKYSNFNINEKDLMDMKIWSCIAANRLIIP